MDRGLSSKSHGQWKEQSFMQILEHSSATSQMSAAAPLMHEKAYGACVACQHRDTSACLQVLHSKTVQNVSPSPPKKTSLFLFSRLLKVLLGRKGWSKCQF